MIGRRGSGIGSLGALLVLAMIPGGLLAQVRVVPPGGDASRQEMLRSLQGQYEEQMARQLELTPEQREFLREVFVSFGQRRAELLPRRTGVMREVHDLLQDGSPSEERALTLMRDLRELRQVEADLLLEEELRLLEQLSPIQVLRFQVLRDQFGERVRVLRAGDSPAPFGPWRGGGSGPPGTPRR